MKQSVSFSDFVDAFHAYDRFDQFGYDALKVIFDYISDYEIETGVEEDLDVIAICCHYSVSDWETIAQDYRIDLEDYENDDEKEQAVLNYLNEKTIVVGTCKDGIVYGSDF